MKQSEDARMKLNPGSRLANVMNHWSDAIRVQGVEAPETLSRLISLLPLIEPAKWGGEGEANGGIRSGF